MLSGYYIEDRLVLSQNPEDLEPLVPDHPFDALFKEDRLDLDSLICDPFEQTHMAANTTKQSDNEETKVPNVVMNEEDMSDAESVSPFETRDNIPRGDQPKKP